jgi:hypothetical protein
LQKRRNAWALGAVVVGKLSQIEALQASKGLSGGDGWKKYRVSSLDMPMAIEVEERL